MLGLGKTAYEFGDTFFFLFYCVNKFFNFCEDADEKIYYGECSGMVQGKNREDATLCPFFQDYISKEK